MLESRYWSVAGVAAIALAGTAIAQTTDSSTQHGQGLGTDVSAMAKAQKDSETKGIGADVSAMAHARNDARKQDHGKGGDDAERQHQPAVVFAAAFFHSLSFIHRAGFLFCIGLFGLTHGNGGTGIEVKGAVPVFLEGADPFEVKRLADVEKLMGEHGI